MKSFFLCFFSIVNNDILGFYIEQLSKFTAGILSLSYLIYSLLYIYLAFGRPTGRAIAAQISSTFSKAAWHGYGLFVVECVD